MLIQLCRTKFFIGEMGISNTYHATRVIVEQQYDEILDYKSRLHVGVVLRTYDGSQLSNTSFVSIKEELQSANIVFTSLEKLKQIDVSCKVWIVATITEILWDKSWFYTSCAECKKKVTEVETKFICDDCTSYVADIRLHIKVVDGSDMATLLLWNRTTHPLIGKSVAALCQNVILDSFKANEDALNKEVDNLDRPTDIEKICGLELHFKVVVHDKNLEGGSNVYTVERYCNDVDMIELHKKIDHITHAGSSDVNDDMVGDSKWSLDLNVGGIGDGEFKSPDDEMSGKRVCDDTFGCEILHDGEASTSSSSK